MNIKESETIELKRSTSELKEGVISICATLNKHHEGKLYFGISNDGYLVSVPLLVNQPYHNCFLLLDIGIKLALHTLIQKVTSLLKIFIAYLEVLSFLGLLRLKNVWNYSEDRR